MALGGQTVQLSMVGCPAGGALFAVSAIDMGSAQRAADALAQWQLATQTAQKATKSVAAAHQVATTPVAGGPSGGTVGSLVVSQLPQSGLAHALYFSQGSVVYQAQVLGQPQAGGDGPSALSSQAVETFLGGLRLNAN